MRKTPYTTRLILGEDARRWEAVLDGYIRHKGPGSLDRAALVVMDMQRYFLDERSPANLPAAGAIIDNVNSLIAGFHDAGLTVVFTRHSDPAGQQAGDVLEQWWGRRLEPGSRWVELSPAIHVGPDDLIIDKRSYSAFEGTGLEEDLREKGVDTLVLAGVQTHLCVETTARHAFTLGMMPVVTLDATAAPDLDLHLGSLRGLGHGLARIVAVRDLVGVVCGAGALVGNPVEEPGRSASDMARTAPLDVLVVGGGPAGISAAVQAHRMGLATRLVERAAPGGLVNAANCVENYPGFPGGISGKDLAMRFRSHAGAIGVDWSEGEVVDMDSTDAGLEVSLADGSSLSSRVVVAATGTVPAGSGIPGEDDLKGRTLFYRVDEALPAFMGKDVIVVGGGDCAIDQALHLWHRGHGVTVLVRGRRPRALELLVSRAAGIGVEIRLGTVVESVRQDGDEVVLVVRGPDEAGATHEVRCGFVLVATGRTPCLPAVAGAEPDDIAEGTDILGRTDIRGLYLAGDCRRSWIRQTAVAAGDGVACAMDAWRYLQTGDWK